MQKIKAVVYPVGFKEEEGIREQLRQMMTDTSYNTVSSYIPTSTAYPDGLLPFVDRHMRYLNAHPKLDAALYLANVRLMTRIGRIPIRP